MAKSCRLDGKDTVAWWNQSEQPVSEAASACSIRVRGVVQGVGFRPYVYRLAQENTLTGWVLNGNEGVEIYLEGAEFGLQAFVRDLKKRPPAAATISAIEIDEAEPLGLHKFTIRQSTASKQPIARISPDLSICDDCVKELLDPANRRFGYPYINCTNCGPRYTVIRALPYDRQNTTMERWPLDSICNAEYVDPGDRRFHAQPTACAACGPRYRLHPSENDLDSKESIARAAQVLHEGGIVAIKGLGGYHLACDARNSQAVRELRERKYRKEKPFALLAKHIAIARNLVDLSPDAEALLTSVARPIVLAPAKVMLSAVAPDNAELGVMLPHTPVHHLLFANGAPPVLVMTSANRSSEPIAYEDDGALQHLAGIADYFLIGERPIARRVDDSVVRDGPFGPVILRRGRGYAPGAVALVPSNRPILALGADLKNTITLVVDGEAFVSQHIGDLSDYRSFRAFTETVNDLTSMYEVDRSQLLIAHDLHPQYASTLFALECEGVATVAVQHHRAHIASVLAERGEWHQRVVGVSMDGTGYGDDGSIWGGEIFVGSVATGFERVGHLREAVLPGGDAAVHSPVQAAAGFLADIEDLPDLTAPPFNFPKRYLQALRLMESGARTFKTTSAGRLFDTVAALLGFTRDVTFEGQAAIWLEQQAVRGNSDTPYPLLFVDGILDFRGMLRSIIDDRLRRRPVAEIARSFQLGFSTGLHDAILQICNDQALSIAVLSGGVFQNNLLLADLKTLFQDEGVAVWTNHAVPPNDGGISLGQAAMAAFTASAN